MTCRYMGFVAVLTSCVLSFLLSPHVSVSTTCKKENNIIYAKVDNDVLATTSLRRVPDLPSDYRICRLNDPPPQLGQPAHTAADSPILDRMGNIPVYFQCAGKLYEDFIEIYQNPFILNRSVDFPDWGKRRTILPPRPPPSHQGSTTNKRDSTTRIVVVGNSHTRQWVWSLMCQYRDHIWSTQKVPHQKKMFVFNLMEMGRRSSVLSITAIINNPFAYSSSWKSNLERILGYPIQYLDAFILGAFNPFDPEYNETSQMWKNMWQFARTHPSHNIHLDRYPEGFDLGDVATVFSGPIVAVSMLSDKSDTWYERVVRQHQDLKEASSLSGRKDNIRTIYARHYREAMGRQDCMSDNKTHVSTCDSKLPNSNFHRCFGARGGQPDLVAWDVVEALWELFG